MPAFDTPTPISATISLLAGDVHIGASDRSDTIVEVRPVNPGSKADVKIAEQTRVEYADGKLLVKTPKHLGGWFTRTGLVDVTVRLPTGSQTRVDTGMGDIRADGELGDCDLKTGMGHASVEQCRGLRITSGSGRVSVGHAGGDTHVSTGHGIIHIRYVDGTAHVQNSSGDTWIGEVTGNVRVSAASGDVTVDRAHADVSAKTAAGSLRVRDIARGRADLRTAVGDVEVGIRQGTAAWLDVNTTMGAVRNSLTAADGPVKTEERLELTAHTYHGDIIIRRP